MQRRQLTPEEAEDAKRLRKMWAKKKDDLLLSQVKAAKDMGFNSQAAVSQYLNAKMPLNMEAVAKFAKVLRVKVEDISPRYAQMVGNPIPSELDGYTAPKTGSIGGVNTKGTLDWFAFSKSFYEAMGCKSIKTYLVEKGSGSKKVPDGSVVFIDESYQKTAADGTYMLLQGDHIVLREILVNGDQVVIQDGKKMTISKEAFGLIKVLGRVLAVISRV